MSTLDLHEPRQQARNGGFEAVVASNPASYADLVELTIDAFDPGLRYGPCPWLGPPGFLPQRGDRALVVMDDSQGPWAFVQATAPGPAQGNADLLDGHDSTYFATAADLTSGLAGKLGLHAKADDSDLLDGKDSLAFLQQTLADVKGDLIAASGADVFARLAVGADARALVADSAQALGLKYALLANANIDPAAAIARSKLNFGAGLVDADIAAGAAIALSKLAAPAFTTYTPAWTSTGTAPALGNGTIVGRYNQIGKQVQVYIALTMGSTTTFGTGIWLFSLPVTMRASSFHNGTARADDASTAATYGLFVHANDATTVIGVTPGGPAAFVGSTIPITWATGDLLIIDYLYEAA